MADGAGTPYCADEGYFSPQQMERIEAKARSEAEWHKARARAIADLPESVSAWVPRDVALRLLADESARLDVNSGVLYVHASAFKEKD